MNKSYFEEEDLERCKVAELKFILKERGLKVSGRKDDLIFRLLCHQEVRNYIEDMINNKEPEKSDSDSEDERIRQEIRNQYAAEDIGEQVRQEIRKELEDKKRRLSF